MMNSLTSSDFLIRLMIEDDLSHSWTQALSKFKDYYAQQEQGERCVFIALYKDSVIGYVSLHFISDDPVFSSRAIPEIVDLNVFEPYRNKGVATALIKACEQEAWERGWTVIGIGVELGPRYAAARHLYPKLS